MSELQKIKHDIMSQLQGLCAHCASNSNRQHRCPVREISLRVQSLRGVPLIVNSQFKGVLWPRV